MRKSNKTEIAREYNKKTYDRICLTVKKGNVIRLRNLQRKRETSP